MCASVTQGRECKIRSGTLKYITSKSGAVVEWNGITGGLGDNSNIIKPFKRRHNGVDCFLVKVKRETLLLRVEAVFGLGRYGRKNLQDLICNMGLQISDGSVGLKVVPIVESRTGVALQW